MPVNSDVECSPAELAVQFRAIRRMADLPRPSPEYRGGKPFYFGGPVQVNSAFVGRRKELQQFAEDAGKGQHISLVGQRRMGKSSLLWQLHLERRTLMPGCLVGYVDMQGYSCNTQRGFLTMALRTLVSDLDDPTLLGRMQQEKIIGDLCEDDAVDMPSFGHALRLLAPEAGDTRRPPVLMIDEFEVMLQYRSEFDDAFFGALRNLGNRGYVAYVVASHQPLTSLLSTEAMHKSSFPNVFTQRTLSCFTPEESRELVTQPNDRPFDEREVALALKLGRHYPHLLQLACSEIYRAKQQTPYDLGSVEREFAQLVSNTTAEYPESIEPRGQATESSKASGPTQAWLRPFAAIGRVVRLVGSVNNEIQNALFGIIVILVIILMLLGIIPLPDLAKLFSK